MNSSSSFSVDEEALRRLYSSEPDLSFNIRSRTRFPGFCQRRESEPICVRRRRQHDEESCAQWPTNRWQHSSKSCDETGKISASVGFYDIYHPIGRGNYGLVRIAKHRYIKHEVAVKIIDKKKLDWQSRIRLYKEIDVLKCLNHAYIIKLHQIIDEKDKIYIFTELAEKGEIFNDVVDHVRYSEKEARHKFWQIILAMEYMHNRGVVHRDLKAENILLDKNDRVKIADFGFASFHHIDEPQTAFCGSPPYAAPEIFLGKPYFGPKADIWSLGVCLYIMTAGSMPFEGDSFDVIRYRVLDGRYRVPFYMSMDCEDLIRRMLTKNPSRRATIEEIKRHPWMLEDDCEDKIRNEIHTSYFLSHGASEYSVNSFIQKIGIKKERIQEAVFGSTYNHIHGMYNLLMEKYRDKWFDETLQSVMHRKEMENRLKKQRKTPSLKSLRNAEHSITVDSGTGDSIGEMSRQCTVCSSVDEGVEDDLRLSNHSLIKIGKRPSTDSVDKIMQTMSIGESPEKRLKSTISMVKSELFAKPQQYINYKQTLQVEKQKQQMDQDWNLDPQNVRARMLHQEKRQQNMARLAELKRRKSPIPPRLDLV